MALRTAGLQTAIWNNNLKSLLLLALYPLIVAALVWVAATLYGANFFAHSGYAVWPRAVKFGDGMTLDYLPLIATIVLVWFVIAYFGQTRMIRTLARAAPVARSEQPLLYNLVENLCLSRGLPMPQINVIETDALNAFASGIDKNSYGITVTRGLLDALPPDELEAVLAHEISHILNKDVRLMIVAIIFVGMFGFLAQLLWSQLRWGFYYQPRRNERDGGMNWFLVLLAVDAILFVGYLTTSFTRLALSRHRESMADEGAVTLTKNPEALMRALQRIDGRGRIPHVSRDIARLCIDDEGSGFFGSLFSDHPPIKTRVAQIARLTGTPVPSDDPAPAADTIRNPWVTPDAPAPPPPAPPGPRNPWQ